MKKPPSAAKQRAKNARRRERKKNRVRHLAELARSVSKKAEEVDRLSAIGLVRATPASMLELPRDEPVSAAAPRPRRAGMSHA